MTKETILKKAIEKANRNGLDCQLSGSGNTVYIFKRKNDVYTEQSLSIHGFIFSHDFAKAFWGEGWVCTGYGEPTELEEGEAGICEHNYSISGEEKAFEYHLQQMVLEKDPIKYLERYL